MREENRALPRGGGLTPAAPLRAAPNRNSCGGVQIVGGSNGQFVASVPPSTSNTLPVTQLEAGEAR